MEKNEGINTERRLSEDQEIPGLTEMLQQFTKNDFLYMFFMALIMGILTFIVTINNDSVKIAGVLIHADTAAAIIICLIPCIYVLRIHDITMGVTHVLLGIMILGIHKNFSNEALFAWSVVFTVTEIICLIRFITRAFVPVISTISVWFSYGVIQAMARSVQEGMGTINKDVAASAIVCVMVICALSACIKKLKLAE